MRAHRSGERPRTGAQRIAQEAGCDPTSRSSELLHARVLAPPALQLRLSWQLSPSQAFWRRSTRPGPTSCSGTPTTTSASLPRTERDSRSPRGSAQFVVGTGGAFFTSSRSVKPNSEVRQNDHLRGARADPPSTSYEWRFLPEAGRRSPTRAAGLCHGRNTRVRQPTTPAKGLAPESLHYSGYCCATTAGRNTQEGRGPRVGRQREDLGARGQRRCPWRRRPGPPYGGGGPTASSAAPATTWSTATVAATEWWRPANEIGSTVIASSPRSPPRRRRFDLVVGAGARGRE